MQFGSIKLLTDENVSPKVVDFFRKYKMDVFDIKEKSLCGIEDEEILNIALKEKRFILTHDSDFGSLTVFGGKKFYGIIFIRVKNLSSQNVIKVCERLLKIKNKMKR